MAALLLHFFPFLLCWLIPIAVSSSSVEHQHGIPTIFYVALNGNDSWSGRFAAPNQNGTDGPFASLEAARLAVRALRSGGAPPLAGVTVYIRRGIYERTVPFTLTAEDSGNTSAPIIWAAYPGDTVVITGSHTVGRVAQLTDPGFLSRLVPAARGKVLKVDLRSEGVSDYGTILPRGGPGLELFVRGERYTLARWPETGWELIADVPQTGDSLLHPGLEREKRFKGVPAGRHYGRFTYTGDRPSRWGDTREILLHGYWTFDWSDSYHRLASLDTVHKQITVAHPHHYYGYTTNQRFAYVNVLEELDKPGEWYIDRPRGVLLFIPRAPLRSEDVRVTVLDQPLVVLDNTSNIRFKNVQLLYSRASGVLLRGGHDNRIEGCTLRGLGGEAIVVDGGTGHHVDRCELSDLALGGIRLHGGDRKTLAPGNLVAENNHIHDYSRWLRTGQYALFLDGVGCQVRHNEIHDAPHEGLYLRGNDHIIEYNEFYRLTQETGDAGALHTGRDWTWRGNVIRYNYFHDLKGPGLHGVTAVYLDDFASGFTVNGNVFLRAGRAVELGGGRDNIVANNLFVSCVPSVHIDARGLGWASYYINGNRMELYDLMDSVRATQPPYSERYPQLLSLVNDQPAVPKGTRVVRNISYGGRWLDVYDFGAFDFRVVTMKENVIADPDVWRRRKEGQKGWDPYYLNIDMQEGYELLHQGDPRLTQELPGNIFTTTDPGIGFQAGGIPFVADSTLARRIGFERIPTEAIGRE